MPRTRTNEQARAYYAAHRDSLCAYHSAWAKRNRNKVKLYKERYYVRHPEQDPRGAGHYSRMNLDDAYQWLVDNKYLKAIDVLPSNHEV